MISVLVRNMGHNEDGGKNDAQKAPRGLLSASVVGSDAPVSWRIQGVRGGEALVDRVRGPQNNGGLYGERSGWSLPGFDDSGWESVSLPHRESAPGVSWYRTRVRLDLPRDQDVPVGLRFTDDPSRHYRVLIFVNGWNVGQYVNDVGPQHVFVLPQGILRHQGTNTIALAVWSDEAEAAGLRAVDLVALGNTATSLRVHDRLQPGLIELSAPPPHLRGHVRRHRGRSPRRGRLDGHAPRAPRAEGPRRRPRRIPERHALHPSGPGARRRPAARAGGSSTRWSRPVRPPAPARALRSRAGRPRRALPGVRGRDAVYSPRRTLLDKLLVDAARAAGAEVRERFAFDALVFDGDRRDRASAGARQVAAAVTETARLVVGADGRHSAVAKAVRAPAYHVKPALSDAPTTRTGRASRSRGGEIYGRDSSSGSSAPGRRTTASSMTYVAAPASEFHAFRADPEGHVLAALDLARRPRRTRPRRRARRPRSRHGRHAEPLP